jgi:hypothetical protein
MRKTIILGLALPKKEVRSNLAKRLDRPRESVLRGSQGRSRPAIPRAPGAIATLAELHFFRPV